MPRPYKALRKQGYRGDFTTLTGRTRITYIAIIHSKTSLSVIAGEACLAPTFCVCALVAEIRGPACNILYAFEGAMFTEYAYAFARSVVVGVAFYGGDVCPKVGVWYDVNAGRGGVRWFFVLLCSIVSRGVGAVYKAHVGNTP